MKRVLLSNLPLLLSGIVPFLSELENNYINKSLALLLVFYIMMYKTKQQNDMVSCHWSLSLSWFPGKHPVTLTMKTNHQNQLNCQDFDCLAWIM